MNIIKSLVLNGTDSHTKWWRDQPTEPSNSFINEYESLFYRFALLLKLLYLTTVPSSQKKIKFQFPSQKAATHSLISHDRW